MSATTTIFVICHYLFFTLLGITGILLMSAKFTALQKKGWGLPWWLHTVCMALICGATLYASTSGFQIRRPNDETPQMALIASLAAVLIISFVRYGFICMARMRSTEPLMIEVSPDTPYPALILGVASSTIVPGVILYHLAWIYPQVLSDYLVLGRALLLVAAILLSWDSLQHGRIPRGGELPRRAVGSAVGMGVCLLAFLLALGWTPAT
jgi:hypothetical protein